MGGVVEFDALACSDVVADHGEGVVWDPARGELLWVDLGVGRLHRGRPGDGGVEHLGTIRLDVPLGAVAPLTGGEGWIAAAGHGVARLARDGALTWLAEPDAGREGVRMNDAACDPGGRFWAGTMAEDETPGAGALYRFDPDGTLTTMVARTTVSNGLGWSADATTMWFADSGEGAIDAFRFDAATGAIADRRRVITIAEDDGVPDGLTVDADDHLWVAIWDGGEVRRYTPAGELVARVRVPVSRPTRCCFGGADLATLYISTARVGLSEEQLREQPDAGRLFAVAPGVPGVAQPAFG